LLRARYFADAVAPAREAAALFAAYPNNRWWRMCSHDLAARSLALSTSSNLEEANEELEKARDMWLASTKTDALRRAELACTTGIIAWSRKDYDRACSCFEESCAFDQESPCILHHHLILSARAHAEAGYYAKSRELSSRAGQVREQIQR
jgi:tetratricopeptide (TPR) repeat protein